MLVLLYQGRPLKRRDSLPGNRIKLTFLGPPGQVAERLIVTQADWTRHGNGDGVYVADIKSLEQLRQRYAV